MLKFIPIVICFILCLACNNSSNTNETLVAKYEKYMSGDKLVIDSIPDTLAYVLQSMPVNNNNEDAKRLFNAASLHSKAGRTMQAVALLERINAECSNSKYVPEALISAGVNYENLGMVENARKVYGMFISKFPNHAMVNQIKQSLLNTEPGKEKTPEQQLEEILKNKK